MPPRCLPDAFQMAPRWLSDDSSSMSPPLRNPTWFLLHDFSFMIPPSPWFLFHVPPSPLGLRHGHRRGSRFEAIFRYFWGLEIRLQKVRPKVPKLCPKTTPNREKINKKSALEFVLENVSQNCEHPCSQNIKNIAFSLEGLHFSRFAASLKKWWKVLKNGTQNDLKIIKKVIQRPSENAP